jgi:hypothetical protein
MNTITGKPAVRWLDDLIEKVGEINPRLAEAILKRLPEEDQSWHKEMLQSIGIEV